ncbi:Rieske 2Fe-2S domain-containing protein [Amycolatopsis sp. NPDC006131]|uniref:Rieske 2Fe-2S domain-containing protein n=1 Tax=Amycolatopsis sp. NPDC006131 TaxID=3156731 RepID=UPI0033B01C70
MITNAWYVAGFSPDFVRGRLHAPVVAGLPLVLWRTLDGEVVAYDGRCRHKRFPLLCSPGAR